MEGIIGAGISWPPVDDRDDLLAMADAMAPMLEKSAHDSDRGGRLSEEGVSLLRAAGFLALQRPERFGGPEAGVRTSFEVYRRLARGCGSSAWVAMILSGSAYTAALFAERAQEDIWGGDGLAAVCSNFTLGGAVRPAPGGGRVSGRWLPMSGVHEAQWTIVAVRGTRCEDGDQVYLALVPMNDASVEKSWETVGMRATGSDTVVVDDVFVPHHRYLAIDRLLDGRTARRPRGSVYGATWLSLLAVTALAPVVGMAEAAVDHALTLVDGKVLPLAPGERPARLHSDLAAAMSLIDTAILHADRAIRDVEVGALAGRQLGLEDRARIRMDIGRAASAARQAVGTTLTVAGNQAFSTHSPLQRIWRDIEFVSRHTMISPERNHEVYSQVLFGGVTPGLMV